MNMPYEIDRHAPVVADHRIRIAAPPELVWRVQTDVARWPSWQSDIEDAAIDGPLAVGTSFRWQTYGMTIVSTIYAYEPGHRVLWGGSAGDIVGIHEWRFTAVHGGVEVQTLESFGGAPVAAAPKTMQHLLDKSLVDWLARLKQASEAAAVREGSAAVSLTRSRTNASAE